MNRSVKVSPATEAAQRKAADPGASVWVAANAGSGKTHVLVERVLALLLAGVNPEAILCLTYTKAAAAEMRKRVAGRLATWAVFDEAKLKAELTKMQGRTPDGQALQRARMLFVRALETPGGLKINTIHAFCESILHRFPLEARVPFDFAVIEDGERAEMVLAAREAVLAGGRGESEAVSEAVSTLFDLMSDSQITDAIDAALAEARKLRPVLADRAKAKAQLRQFVGAGNFASRAAVYAEMVSGHGLTAAHYRAVLALTPAAAEGTRFEDKLARLDPGDAASLCKTFLTGTGTVPKKGFPKKAISTAAPDLADMVVNEAVRLAALWNDLARAALIERSEAVLEVVGAISDRYEAEKQARSLLDFDDLVEKLGDLLADEALGPWVHYKLDAAITHILVDESQDTNPEQWRVVDHLAREFFVGDSAANRVRTVFAVGDEKQSIYSFQGADPALFGDYGAQFRRRAGAANARFDDVRLETSFRTLRNILEAVDKVALRPDVRAGLLASEIAVHHESDRADPGGIVTLWKPIQQQASEDLDPDNWPLEVPKMVKSAPRQVAERIADEICGWLKAQRPLGRRGRAVRADDILILVQTRGPLFSELIRALIAKRLPTPGADRLAVTSHIGVLDLLALGDVLVNPADDLQLAALLRSPLFDIDEDGLLALAHGRSGTLWEALGAATSGPALAARSQLEAWRSRLDFERPFEFFADVLYAGGGLKRFHARLGGEVDDVFAEFLELALAHEQTPQPSLQGFLAAMRAEDISIRRELSETAAGVRVMTVHGAKGLEAPIVILADAASKQDGSRLGKPVYLVSDARGPLLVHAAARADHVPQTFNLREADEAAQKAEYWRKLYVGMTRAEDELYLTGFLTPGRDADGQIEGTWYEAVAGALAAASEIIKKDGEIVKMIYPAVRDAVTPATPVVEPQTQAAPPLALAPLPGQKAVPVVSPSSAFTETRPERALETGRDEGLASEAARQEGLAVHALLQHLGKVPRAEWENVARKAASALLPQAPERQALLAHKAVAILTNPDFGHIFGPQSRAEVPFLMRGRRNGEPITLAGRIDRLVVASDRVMVVDYKSDANPARIATDVPRAYLTQVGLYALVAGQLFPGLAVEAAILWTRLESLMILPPQNLSDAASGFTLE